MLGKQIVQEMLYFYQSMISRTVLTLLLQSMNSNLPKSMKIQIWIQFEIKFSKTVLFKILRSFFDDIFFISRTKNCSFRSTKIEWMFICAKLKFLLYLQLHFLSKLNNLEAFMIFCVNMKPKIKRFQTFTIPYLETLRHPVYYLLLMNSKHKHSMFEYSH